MTDEKISRRQFEDVIDMFFELKEEGFDDDMIADFEKYLEERINE